MSSKLILCDRVRNSHDHSVLQSIDVTRRNLMLITLRAFKVLISILNITLGTYNVRRLKNTNEFTGLFKISVS